MSSFEKNFIFKLSTKNDSLFFVFLICISNILQQKKGQFFYNTKDNVTFNKNKEKILRFRQVNTFPKKTKSIQNKNTNSQIVKKVYISLLIYHKPCFFKDTYGKYYCSRPVFSN